MGLTFLRGAEELRSKVAEGHVDKRWFCVLKGELMGVLAKGLWGGDVEMVVSRQSSIAFFIINLAKLFIKGKLSFKYLNILPWLTLTDVSLEKDRKIILDFDRIKVRGYLTEQSHSCLLLF